MLRLYTHRKVAQWENQWENFPRNPPMFPDVFDDSLLRRKPNIQVRESALRIGDWELRLAAHDPAAEAASVQRSEQAQF